MFTVTVTDTNGETSERTHTRKADAIRGAQRKQKRLPDAMITVFGPDDEHVWGSQPKPDEPAPTTPNAEPKQQPAEPIAEVTVPQTVTEQPKLRRTRIGDPDRVTVKPDIKATRPFTIQNFTDGDFVLDVTTTRKDGEPRVLLVTLSNPNEPGHPCFLHTGDTATPGGLIRGLDGYWQPVVYARRDGTGDVRAVGKRAGNKENAVRALIDLWVATFTPDRH